MQTLNDKVQVFEIISPSKHSSRALRAESYRVYLSSLVGQLQERTAVPDVHASSSELIKYPVMDTHEHTPAEHTISVLSVCVNRGNKKEFKKVPNSLFKKSGSLSLICIWNSF